jgi:hypothetical protein
MQVRDGSFKYQEKWWRTDGYCSTGGAAPPACEGPSVGPCLGPNGGPRGVGIFLLARYPCTLQETYSRRAKANACTWSIRYEMDVCSNKRSVGAPTDIVRRGDRRPRRAKARSSGPALPRTPAYALSYARGTSASVGGIQLKIAR